MWCLLNSLSYFSMTAFWVVWPTVKSLYSLPALKCFFQKEGNVILIRTLTGLRWFDIDCTDNEDALYLDKVALIDNFAHSCHILFQNKFHRIEKSDIVCIRDDQCDILWQCITWINKGFLFANQKQSFEAFLSTHTLTIDPYNIFFINLVLTPPISFSKSISSIALLFFWYQVFSFLLDFASPWRSMRNVKSTILLD